MAETSKAQLKANAKWDAANVTRRTVKFYAGKDDDVLAYYDAQPNKMEWLKELIRREMR